MRLLLSDLMTSDQGVDPSSVFAEAVYRFGAEIYSPLGVAASHRPIVDSDFDLGFDLVGCLLDSVVRLASCDYWSVFLDCYFALASSLRLLWRPLAHRSQPLYDGDAAFGFLQRVSARSSG